MYFFHLGKDEEVAGVRDFGNPVCQATGQLRAALHNLADVGRDIGQDEQCAHMHLGQVAVIHAFFERTVLPTNLVTNVFVFVNAPIGFDKRLRRLLNSTRLHLDEQDMPQRRDNHQVQLPKVLITLVHGGPRQVVKNVEVSGQAVAQDL